MWVKIKGYLHQGCLFVTACQKLSIWGYDGRHLFFQVKIPTAQNTTRCSRKNSSIFGVGFDNKLYLGKGPILLIYSSFFFFRLFPIWGRLTAKVFSFGQLRLSLSLAPTISMSSLTKPIHLLFDLPRFLLPNFLFTHNYKFISETPLTLTALPVNNCASELLICRLLV